MLAAATCTWSESEYINGWNEATCTSSFVRASAEGEVEDPSDTHTTERERKLQRQRENRTTEGQERLARHGSGEAIIMKKRFVLEKFLPCAWSYEGRLNSHRVRVWATQGLQGMGHNFTWLFLHPSSQTCTVLTYFHGWEQNLEMLEHKHIAFV